MTRHRRPPTWHPRTDDLARDCGVTTVSFNNPIPDETWCHYCGFLADSRDHIVADSVGGVDAWWNLVPSCKPCNEGKADRQSCACLFCLRAMALWSFGFKRIGSTRAEKKKRARQKELQA